MNTTELKISLKSNPISNSKLHNNVLNYIIPYSLLLQKRERKGGCRKKEPHPAQSAKFNYETTSQIQQYENKNSTKRNNKIKI